MFKSDMTWWNVCLYIYIYIYILHYSNMTEALVSGTSSLRRFSAWIRDAHRQGFQGHRGGEFLYAAGGLLEAEFLVLMCWVGGIYRYVYLLRIYIYMFIMYVYVYSFRFVFVWYIQFILNIYIFLFIYFWIYIYIFIYIPRAHNCLPISIAKLGVLNICCLGTSRNMPQELYHLERIDGAKLPCLGLSWFLTQPPFWNCAIYFHHGVTILLTIYNDLWWWRTEFGGSQSCFSPCTRDPETNRI